MMLYYNFKDYCYTKANIRDKTSLTLFQLLSRSLLAVEARSPQRIPGPRFPERQLADLVQNHFPFPKYQNTLFVPIAVSKK